MSLATVLSHLDTARDALVDSLGSKGVTVASSATILSCASAILDVPTGADVTLGVVDASGKFQAFTFSGTTPADSGDPETVTDYKTWNSTLPAPANPTLAALIDESITSFDIPSGVTSIGPFALYYRQALTSVTIPSGVITIGNGAFYLCTALSSINIPSGVTTIGTNVFAYCTSLTSITLPASVTTIGTNAFTGCTNLTDIYCGFAEGAVSDAPWGAPNATIHYAQGE